MTWNRPAPRVKQWEGDTLPTPRLRVDGVDLVAGPRLVFPLGQQRATNGIYRVSAPIPKENALQHAGYMAAVRLLPCARCGISGFSQFCHADEGKGAAIKTDCRLGWPGCGPHHGRPGCHWYVGTSGRMLKAERREFERQAGARTRALIIAAGQWPKRLPLWKETQ